MITLWIQIIGTIIILFPAFLKKNYSIEDVHKNGFRILVLGLSCAVIIVGIGIVDYYLNISIRN